MSVVYSRSWAILSPTRRPSLISYPIDGWKKLPFSLHRYSLKSSTLLLPLPCYPGIGRLQILHLSLGREILIVQRIIALSSFVCCKLLEHIVCHSTRDHLDNHDISSVFQHGFRAGHSWDSQLLSTVYDLMSIFDSKCQVVIAVLDFSKAFDVVPHQRLLGKIKHYGISGTTLSWISDFLSRRTQQVVVDGSYSEWSTVHSRLPKGTVQGPLLFLLYLFTMY